MPRNARKQSESNIYHVISRGVGRCIIFEDDNDRIRFLRALEKYARDHHAEILAWCLMSNHFHLLARAELDDLAEFMRELNASYALYFNKRHERIGHLFQGRYKSEPVADDRYFLTVLRYIHQNPARASVCPTHEYRWSSYGEYLFGTGISRTDLALAMLGGPEKFVSFHALADDATPCMELSSGRRFIHDEDALQIARNALVNMPNARPESLASLDKPERDEALRTLRRSRLSLRQIERLTGISKSTIAKATATPPGTTTS